MNLSSLYCGRERGQAMVESAIVFPMLIFTVLGILQLTLVHQARMMLEYAAFNAARVGAVWNADPDKMQRAAVLALLPTMPSPPVDSIINPCPNGMRVDDPLSLLCRWTWVQAWNAQGFTKTVFGKPQISVETLNPLKDDFGGQQEIDFDLGGDSLDIRKKSQLTIRVTYFYELRIPVINWVFFESWLAGMAGVGLQGINPFEPGITTGLPGATGASRVEVPDATVRMGYEWFKLPQSATNCSFTGLTKNHVMRLLGVGRALGKWYLPLVTTYTIRMQSNPFLRNAGTAPKCN
jgi:TadE-like protein